MAYKVHPGITILNICGAHMLVATRQYWEQFPRIRSLPPFWAACWTLMERGQTDQEVVASFVRLLRKPKDRIQEQVEKMVSSLAEEGYLVEAEKAQ